MILTTGILPDPTYCGRILYGTFSRALKKRVAEYIQCFRTFEETGTPAIPYISAWSKGEKEIWYEFTSRKFHDLFGSNGSELAGIFRKSVIGRRHYSGPDVINGTQETVIEQDRLGLLRFQLRADGQSSGGVEAVYQVSIKNGRRIWLKDQATVERHESDGIYLSLGCLTIVSKEMEAEDEIKKHRDRLENLARERTAALTKMNEQLKQEIKEREMAEFKLQESYQRLLKTMDGIVQAMSLTVEERDPYTAGHQKRATGLAVSIAREMGLSEHQVKGLEMAGLIHDMGKISIPSGILSKPGKLNSAEIELIRRHPGVAYEILKGIEFPWPVDKIVLQHHERFDGTGYPQGLAGDETLLEARILSVADVVETVSSHRPYRPSLGLDRALEEISLNRGVLYDAKAVDACVSLFEKKSFHFN
jgi:HD-GYP domain-containing protein (c-di-GMP phosphodiesterase class II)